MSQVPAAPAPAPTAAPADDAPSLSFRPLGWRPVLRLLPWLLGVALAGWAGYQLSLERGTQRLRDESVHRLDLFASAVDGVIKRLEPLPATVGLHPQVPALLAQGPGRGPSPALTESVNEHLRKLNAHLGSLALYVLDERGIVRATSNSAAPGTPPGPPRAPDDSRLGEDLSFRPYYLDALAGRVGRHFAIGLGGEPGYFVSHPIRVGARVVGVAAIKISLDPVEPTWDLLGAPGLLADANEVVILSSQPEWRYTALTELAPETRVEQQLTRLYGGQRIGRFPLDVRLQVEGDGQVLKGMLPGGLVAQPRAGAAGQYGMLALGRNLDGMDWRLMLFADLVPVRHQALLTGMLTAVAAAFFALLALLMRQRQRILKQKLEAKRWLETANAELEHKVARRTRALTETNVRLRREVAERVQAEATLRAAQDELVHAAKMALLGRLATGITHELNQPLGAIRTLSGNAQEFLRRGQSGAAESNLGLIARLADQMGDLIQPLKAFARKAEVRPQPTDVAQALANALFLVGQRLRAEKVQVHDQVPRASLYAWCDPNRLEQVLANLLGNALDAMARTPERQLRLSAGVHTLPEEGDPVAQALARAEAHFDGLTDPHTQAPAPRREVWVEVRDNGSGFTPEQAERLFEPFFTTKSEAGGLGLGLAICRDIVESFGGHLRAQALPEGGAAFTVFLPASAPDATDPPPRLRLGGRMPAAAAAPQPDPQTATTSPP
ncbi:ATP-binding protein [Ideonella livida]|uniref:C4-dicarboxylate transport sensor protein DctB n=1 Tax=Ideonella livida TaxID=2707176 RepID=A0A7C9TNI0_9BURK|nr:ATP-binding protein [Ideonella livida]NDY93287.1 sensor histidine kinase [Ideonella livida]